MELAQIWNSRRTVFLAVRWRFGGGSVATRWRLVTGRRRLVADRHGGGGAPQRVAGRLVTGRRAPRYGSPGALLRGAIRGAIRPRGANESSPRRPECKSPHGPPLAPWRSANGAPCGSPVVGAPCCAKYAPLHGSPLRSPLVTTCDSALTPLITKHESPRALVTAARMKENR